MRCPKCGAEADEPGARFCEMCGAALDEQSAVSGQPSAQMPEAQRPAPDSGPEATAPMTPPEAGRAAPTSGAEIPAEETDLPAPGPAEQDKTPPEPAGPAPDDSPDAGSVAATDRREVLRPYLEALVNAWADGRIDLEDQRVLADLREQYAITMQEHMALEQEVIKQAGGPQQAPGYVAEAPDVESGEVCLEINVNRFLMARHLGVVHLRVTNLTDRALERVRLRLHGPMLPTPFDRSLTVPGQGHVDRKVQQVLPDVGGELLLDVDLCYLVDGEPKAFSGQEILMVLDRDQTPKQLLFDMRGMVQVTAERVYGQSIRLDVEKLVREGRNSPNDLMRMALPDRFRRIRLEFNYEETERLREQSRTAQPPRLAAGFGGRPAALSRASLMWESAGRAHNVVLVAQPEVKFGRTRGLNDVVLRVMPTPRVGKRPIEDIPAYRGRFKESLLEANFQASARIHREAHFIVRVREDGVVFANRGRMEDGVRLNGDIIAGESTVRPDAYVTSRLDIGAVLRFRLEYYPDTPETDEVNVYDNLMGDGRPALWQRSRSAGVRALRFTRLNNLGPDDPNGEECYVLVYRWVQVGCSVGNAIAVPGLGLDEIHARILHFDGGFWLEALRGSGETCVNGRALEPHDLVPLTPGMRLTLGRAEILFTPQRHLYLDE